MAVKRIPILYPLESISPALAKCQAALPEPKVAWSLFVPKANSGGMPTFRRTGKVINPPPPAMESTNPAQSPVRNSNGRIQVMAVPGGVVNHRRRGGFPEAAPIL